MKALLFFISFFISNVHAFTLISATTEANLWPGEQVAFYFDASCDSYRTVLDAAVQEAVELWNSVPTSHLELIVSDGSGDSQISCADLGTGLLGQGQFRGDLVLDSTYVQVGEAVAVAATIAHEMGHVLGLGHSASTDALMYYAELGVRDALRLSQDDMDGLSYLYPRDELGRDSLFGCGSVAVTGSGGGSGDGGGNLVMMLGLMMAIWWISRSSLARARSYA